MVVKNLMLAILKAYNVLLVTIRYYHEHKIISVVLTLECSVLWLVYSQFLHVNFFEFDFSICNMRDMICAYPVRSCILQEGSTSHILKGEIRWHAVSVCEQRTFVITFSLMSFWVDSTSSSQQILQKKKN